MILEDLKRNDVVDDKLWEMIDRANKLTEGGYPSWDSNAQVLIPLMKRILSLSKERREWKVYFYDMMRLFRLSRRDKINDIPLTFQVAEMFHQDYALHLNEKIGYLKKNWHNLIPSLASMILRFYLDYPQIDDQKINRMLEIFLECEDYYGNQLTCGDYLRVMTLAVLNKDKELAEQARKKIQVANFEKSWCYACAYAAPMIEYYLLHKDFESAQDIALSVYKKTIPIKYQKFDYFIQCEGKEDIISQTLTDCLRYGNSQMFNRGFSEWKTLYEKPQEGKIKDTFEVLFHALAGDWSRGEERLRLAEKDDRDRRQYREVPRECLYFSLCWYCYFQMLEKQGVNYIELELGEELPPYGEKQQGKIKAKDKEIAKNYCSGSRDVSGINKRRIWSCQEASQYFEEQADFLGAEMDQARKNFGYEIVKKTFEESFIEKGITNEFSN